MYIYIYIYICMYICPSVSTCDVCVYKTPPASQQTRQPASLSASKPASQPATSLEGHVSQLAMFGSRSYGRAASAVWAARQGGAGSAGRTS